MKCRECNRDLNTGLDLFFHNVTGHDSIINPCSRDSAIEWMQQEGLIP